MPRFNLKVHIPDWITRRVPNVVWRFEPLGKEVFLTFDDGPVPEITPWVLGLLRKENIKATFFCVGENVFKYPEIFQQILDEGHSAGNHTYNHLQGLKTPNLAFYQNIAKAGRLIDSNLFRPPHGLMKRQQFRFLSRRYKIILWDVVSCDYDSSLSGEQVVKNVMDFVRPGSIITFHDSFKAEKNLKFVLPEIIGLLKSQGYSFSKIYPGAAKNSNSKPIANRNFRLHKKKLVSV